MIDTIIDVGRVLVNWDYESYLKRFAFGPEKTKAIAAATFESPYWRQFDRGILAPEEIVKGFCSLAPEYTEEIKEVLRVFEAEDLIDKQICNLSGGQLQRVLLSMALMEEPRLLLLDEPVSGIDQNGMELFYKTIDYLKKNFDLAIVLISHDLDYVKKYADKVLLLDKTVLRQGTPKEVFASDEFKSVFGVKGEA